MYVQVTHEQVQVCEAGDLQRLSVRLQHGMDRSGALALLEQAGLAGPDAPPSPSGEVALSVPRLRALAAAAHATSARIDSPDGDPDWAVGFTQMMDYAASRGWCSDDGAYVTAHIEGVPDAAS